MSKKIYTLLLILNTAFLILNSYSLPFGEGWGGVYAATNVPGGNISGHWTLAGSPYNINGSVIIPNDSTLIIDPGVSVVFQTSFQLTMLVQGRLLAVGTVTDSIHFYPSDITNGFRGIRFNNISANNDSSKLIYCDFKYAKQNNASYLYQNGGALLFNKFSKAIVSHCKIANCSAPIKGGAIYCDSSSNIVISQNQIVNNEAAKGCGIAISLSNPKVTYNTISNNSTNTNSDARGGGLYCISANPIVKYNQIVNNSLKATNLFNRGGGAFFENCINIVVNNNFISNNQAGFAGWPGSGGGIYFFGCFNVTLDSNIISNNSVFCPIVGGTTETGCGGLRLGGGSFLSISNNLISNNSNCIGANGCGIRIDGANINLLERNTIVGNNGGAVAIYGIGVINLFKNNIIGFNTSIDDGAGIYSSNGTIFIIEGCIFNNNSASSVSGKGGAIYLSNNSTNVLNTTFVNNEAFQGGGVFCTNNSNPTFNNCVINGNTASNAGAQVFLNDEGSDPNFSFCDLEGGISSVFSGGNFYTGTYTNNIDANPLFVSPAPGAGSTFTGNYDWSLQAGSPCRNTGNPSGSYPATDLAGNTRVCGNVIDMGAYEFQEMNIAFSTTATSCAGLSDGSATAIVSNGTTPYNYQWNTVPVQTSATATGLAAGIYTVIVTDALNATATANVTVNSGQTNVTPSVSISANPGNTICSGTLVTFTAVPNNGGTSPSYQWKLNGANVGTNSSTYTNAALINGAIITCVITSNANCASPSTATSNAINMTVNSSVVPSVNISANPGNTICSGTSVTYTAVPTNGGTSPTYQWKLNGANVGTNSATYTNATLANGNVITCVLTSNANCASPTTATSNAINMSVNSAVSPSVSISANPGNTICAGTSVTFTAVPTNGGASPIYQWQLNGSNVGTNSTTYTNLGLANGDIITCVMTSNDNCASPLTATSNNINIILSTSLTPSVSISANPGNAICSGTSVTFTAVPTNGGTSPFYQWQVNGSAVGTNSATYTNNNFNDGDVVTCILTSNAACVSPATASANAITLNVVTNLTPQISITSNNNTICLGQFITFDATAINGGSAPTYTWKKNGNTIGFNLPQLIINNIQDGDIITCELTSSESCANPNTALSNGISVTVTPNNFNVDFTASQTNFTTAPYTASFTNNTPNSSAYNFTWYFGDGTISNAVNPNHSYTANGTYTVSLLATSVVSSCTDTLTKFNYITCNNTGANCNFQLSVSPAGPITACLNGTVKLTATTTALNPSYQWTINGVIIGGATQSTYNAIASGNYTVIIYENGGCPTTSNQVAIAFTNPPATVPIINSNGALQPCGQGSVTLSVTAPGASVLWNTGATANSITVNQSGSYTVTASYSPGCQATSQPQLLSASAAANPGICMVTVDSVTNSNYIIWETPLANDIERFYIYKEGNQANVYNQIGTVAYDSLSEFNDINSNPQVQGYRYKIAVLDTCGGLTPMSNFHKTIHLQIFPGVGNNRQLSWSHYEGINFSSYEIWRRLPSQNFQLLTTLASNLNTYTDINPPSLDADYRVDIVLPQVCNSVDRAAYGKSKSNVGNNQAILLVPDGIEDKNLLANLFLLPNPSDGNTMLQWESLKAQNLQIVVTDVVGKVVLTDKVNAQKGLNKFGIEVDAAGVYFVTIFDVNGSKNVLKMVVR